MTFDFFFFFGATFKVHVPKIELLFLFCRAYLHPHPPPVGIRERKEGRKGRMTDMTFTRSLSVLPDGTKRYQIGTFMMITVRKFLTRVPVHFWYLFDHPNFSNKIADFGGNFKVFLGYFKIFDWHWFFFALFLADWQNLYGHFGSKLVGTFFGTFLVSLGTFCFWPSGSTAESLLPPTHKQPR